ncbi:MAG TPA: hypothetical protein VGO31_08950 [Microbacteriaceae bacterium]|jgi:hypothetical protein|nr:hypothetical protein [Microbacteriaceae bacterium]
MPGNPWPHDMTITVEDGPTFLVDLLFVRSVWELNPAGVPPLAREPDPGTSTRPWRPGVEDLERLWLIDWQRAWTEFEDDRSVRIPDAVVLRQIADSSDEELWDAFSARRPSELWYSVGMDRDAANRWRISLADDHRRPLAETPEWQALPALIHAWQQGVDTIIQLPYSGHHVERLNRTHLLVSQETRHNKDLYTDALAGV